MFPHDHPGYISPEWMDAMSAANFGLGQTSRLTFGTDVLVAAYRNPILLAKMAATSVQLPGSRLMIGLGSGGLRGSSKLSAAPPSWDEPRCSRNTSS